MKKGFVLIELLLTIVIASLLSVSLLTVVFQANQLRETIANITSVYSRMAILQSQMERDIMGAFIPTQVDMLQTTTGKTEKIKSLEKIFEGKVQDKSFEMFTCITDNPLTIYLAIKGSKPKPRIGRVVYRLEKDKKQKNSYTLMRQEGTELSLDKYGKDSKIPAYPMIEGIAEFSVEYLQLETQKKEDNQTPDAQEEKKISYKRVASWASEKKESEKKQRSIQLPNYVAVSGSLWDMQFAKKRKFNFMIPLFGSLSWTEQKKENKQNSKLPPKTQPQKIASHTKQTKSKTMVEISEQIQKAMA